MNQQVPANRSRRQFLKLLSGGSMLCMGCSGLLLANPLTAQKGPAEAVKDKFKDDSRMSMEKVFDFTYREITMKVKLLADIMGKDIGREKFLDYLKEAGKESGRIDALNYAKKLGRNDFHSFTSELREPDYTVNHILTFDVLKDQPTVFQVRIKECLWAKTFRKYGAADLGHAMFCNRDFSTCRAFNPKIRLIRDKTIMQGFDHCNHRWVLEA